MLYKLLILFVVTVRVSYAGPCDAVKTMHSHFKDVNPAVVILVANDAQRVVGEKLKTLIDTFDCGPTTLDDIKFYFPVEAPTNGYVIWGGHTDESKAAAKVLNGLLAKTVKGIVAISGGPPPRGGHFEGIAVVVGDPK